MRNVQLCEWIHEWSLLTDSSLIYTQYSFRLPLRSLIRNTPRSVVFCWDWWRSKLTTFLEDRLIKSIHYIINILVASTLLKLRRWMPPNRRVMRTTRLILQYHVSLSRSLTHSCCPSLTNFRTESSCASAQFYFRNLLPCFSLSTYWPDAHDSRT